MGRVIDPGQPVFDDLVRTAHTERRPLQAAISGPLPAADAEHVIQTQVAEDERRRGRRRR
jgi:hypothetical protein